MTRVGRTIVQRSPDSFTTDSPASLLAPYSVRTGYVTEMLDT